jgi:hypothetical protein
MKEILIDFKSFDSLEKLNRKLKNLLTEIKII